jgi:hypothetical protein
VCEDDQGANDDTEDVLWSSMAKVKTKESLGKRQLNDDASPDETSAASRPNVKRHKQKNKPAKLMGTAIL